MLKPILSCLEIPFHPPAEGLEGHTLDGRIKFIKWLFCRDLMVCDVSSRTASLLLAVIQEFWLAMERMPERVTRDDVEFIRSAASYATSFSKNST